MGGDNNQKNAFLQRVQILLDKSSVGVRLIGSHLVLTENGGDLALDFHMIFLCLLPLQSKDKLLASVFVFGLFSLFNLCHSRFSLCDDTFLSRPDRHCWLYVSIQEEEL